MLTEWSTEPPEVKHLKILSICQYVYAFGSVLCGTLMAYYPSLMKWAFENSPQGQSGWTPELQRYFTTVCTVYAVLLYGMAMASVVAGIMITRRKGWLFILILSGIDTLVVPFGTALGIGCLMTLTKPHVKAWFQTTSAEPPPMNPPM